MAGADASDGASDGESVATDPDLEAGSDGEVLSTVCRLIKARFRL